MRADNWRVSSPYFCLTLSPLISFPLALDPEPELGPLSSCRCLIVLAWPFAQIQKQILHDSVAQSRLPMPLVAAAAGTWSPHAGTARSTFCRIPVNGQLACVAADGRVAMVGCSAGQRLSQAQARDCGGRAPLHSGVGSAPSHATHQLPHDAAAHGRGQTERDSTTLQLISECGQVRSMAL